MDNITQKIEKQFGDFMDGYRLLMLTLRGKEGGKINKPDRVAKKLITKDKQEFLRLLECLLEIKKPEERIYSSVNPRDIKKGIRLFKQRQLDADYYDEESKNSFYLDVKNRWISAIMSPKCKAESNFLIDIDNLVGDKVDILEIDKLLEEINVKVLLKYPTKNGWHVITKPFNPALWDNGFGDIKKDGLLLLNY